MERFNRSSYAKVMTILRIGSEIEDKTGTIRVKLVKVKDVAYGEFRRCAQNLEKASRLGKTVFRAIF